MRVKIDFTDSPYPEKLIVDPRKYRGRGRPRNSDYSPIMEVLGYLQRVQNTLFSQRLDAVLLK